LDIGSNAFLFGDGVTIILGTGAHANVGNSGGFVINFKGTSGTFNNTWRTINYIGNNTGTQSISACSSDTDRIDLRKGGFTTGGSSHVARTTWAGSSGSPVNCYQDGSMGTYLSSAKGDIG